ncbi:BBP7 family outer membrane beta-barrel protein [Tuwongella immobilis]|uniref:Uncharacterized protein n=1 Tax=Tuwongella immobilis TaxID=692036 RepID=A0A6C2YL88_9BACT|nr:BBP7 family outer membrane beta-barrel protein [Tuwongella immobilis]VIP01682.1 Protein containing DUF1551 OS=Rhodopirellula maiorica SM1 GN=RMSM_05043 PE=4 SV=1: DUF1551 [Tuwongella immobilis]VTR99134.1 Protein containing DUF1551 OS=Rhodopirellula maiorica SM1 GN=RMSM_05043 PE=4 SV=1: DUF1551 [Tuwongella immobilis]
MRKGFLGSIAALATGASMAWGQSPEPAINPLTTTELVQTQAGAPLEAGSALTDPVPFGGGMMPPGGPGGFGPGMAPGPIGGMPFGGMPAPSFPPPPNFGGGHGGGHGGGRDFVRLYGGVEYLMWFPKSMSVPVPLVTTSAPAGFGVIGSPTTQVLSGGEDTGFNIQSGIRINLGGFLSPNGRVGFDVSGFIMEPRTVSEQAASDVFGLPTIARPFVNSATGFNESLLISFPGYANGNSQVDVSTKLWGTEGSLLLNLYRSEPDSPHRIVLNSTIGYRYIHLDEAVTVNHTSNLVTGAATQFGGLFVTGPVSIGVTDSFRTTNQFNGANFGLNGELRWNRWVIGGGTKIGIGVMHQELEVFGQSTLSPGFPNPVTGIPSATSVVPGGLLTNVNNIGRFNRDEFAVVPEVNVQVGFALTRYATLFAGYNFLYLSDVVRPGDQMVGTVNTGLVPTSVNYGFGGAGAASPTVTSEYWIHGLNFGLQLQF